jgi:hypothetical protein
LHPKYFHLFQLLPRRFQLQSQSLYIFSYQASLFILIRQAVSIMPNLY